MPQTQTSNPSDEQLDLGFESLDPELKEVPLSGVRPNLNSGDASIQSSVSTLGLLLPRSRKESGPRRLPKA